MTAIFFVVKPLNAFLTLLCGRNCDDVENTEESSRQSAQLRSYIVVVTVIKIKHTFDPLNNWVEPNSFIIMFTTY